MVYLYLNQQEFSYSQFWGTLTVLTFLLLLSMVENPSLIHCQRGYKGVWQDIISDNAYEHFLALSITLTILLQCDDQIPCQYLDYTRDY